MNASQRSSVQVLTRAPEVTYVVLGIVKVNVSVATVVVVVEGAAVAVAVFAGTGNLDEQKD